MKYRMGHFVFSITRRGVHPCVEAVAPKAIGVDPGEPGGDTDSWSRPNSLFSGAHGTSLDTYEIWFVQNESYVAGIETRITLRKWGEDPKCHIINLVESEPVYMKWAAEGPDGGPGEELVMEVTAWDIEGKHLEDLRPQETQALDSQKLLLPELSSRSISLLIRRVPNSAYLNRWDLMAPQI
jgi:hypothetical protein